MTITDDLALQPPCGPRKRPHASPNLTDFPMTPQKPVTDFTPGMSSKPRPAENPTPQATVEIDDPSVYQFSVRFKGVVYSFDPLTLRMAMSDRGVDETTPITTAMVYLREEMKLPDLPDTGALQAWKAFARHLEDVQKKIPYLQMSQPTSASNVQGSGQQTAESAS